MAKPTTKQELIEASTKEYTKLISLIYSIPEEHRDDKFDYDVSKEKGAHWTRDQNIRDVLIHVHEWHNLLIKYVNNNENGIETQFLMEGYNWKSYGDMNIVFWKRHQKTSLEESLKLLDKSHNEVMSIVDKYTDDELFKRTFKWTGNNALSSYINSATASHYVWAYKKINKFAKSL